MIRQPIGDIKNPQSKTNFHYYCEYCGHTITFYAFEPEKKVCNFCGRMNFKNEKARFKHLFFKKRREIKNEESKYNYC